MKCFRHAGHDAFGACRVCGKGVCVACSTDLGFALVCSDSCTERAERNEAIISNNHMAYANAKRTLYLLPVFAMVMGAVFVWFGYGWEQKLNFATVLGVVFIAYGIVSLSRNRKLASRLR